MIFLDMRPSIILASEGLDAESAVVDLITMNSANVAAEVGLLVCLITGKLGTVEAADVTHGWGLNLNDGNGEGRSIVGVRRLGGLTTSLCRSATARAALRGLRMAIDMTLVFCGG